MNKALTKLWIVVFGPYLPPGSIVVRATGLRSAKVLTHGMERELHMRATWRPALRWGPNWVFIVEDVNIQEQLGSLLQELKLHGAPVESTSYIIDQLERILGDTR